MTQFRTNQKEYKKLYNLYINKGMSCREIAPLLGLSKSTIRLKLKKYNIPVRSYSEIQRGAKNSMDGKPGKTKVGKDKNWLREEYIIKQRSSVDIAKELGCSYQSVINTLKKYSIPIRDSKKASSMTLKRKSKSGELDKYVVSEKFLINEYKEKKRAIQDIAHEIGCSNYVVRKRLKKYKIPFNMEKDKRGIKERETKDFRDFHNKIIKKYNYSCAICGYDRFVNAHHIIPWSKSADNSIENGICLCPNHHSEAHRGILSEEELRKYQIK